MPVIERNPSTRMCPRMMMPCNDVCHTCEFWDYIEGENKNTGEKIAQWMCLDKQSRLLAIENAFRMQVVADETAALRNEIANQITQHTRHTAQAIGMAAQLAAGLPPPSVAAPVRELNAIANSAQEV